MDSSPHNNNWLGFSLSNHPHFHSHNPLSLLHSFSSSNPVSVVDTNRAINQDVQSCGTTDLAMFTGGGGPKLEDFLGSGGSTSVTTTTNAPVLSFPQFQSEATPVTLSDSEIYDSELKTIAASFLRGFNTIDNHDKQVEALKQQAMAPLQQTPTRKAVDTFGQRTSIYRGVTRHRWTGRYEAHLWDNSCRREGQSRKGRQVYLGGYDKEDKAAKAYDLAALKYWGPTTTTNFPVSDYEKELEEMKNMTRQEFVASLRRKSSGFSRGASIYRGVTRHHQHGRWQARIGRVAGNKDLYLGTFSTQEEAAEAYDIAAIKFRGLNAVTNFEISRYDVKSIANSNLPIGGISTKPKNCSELASDSKSIDGNQLADDRDLSNSASSVTFTSQPTSSTLHFGIPIKPDPSTDYWSNIFGFQNPSPSTTSLNNNKYSKNPTQHLAIAPTSSLFHSSTNDNNNHGYGSGSGSGSGSGLIRNSSFPELNMDFSATTSTTTCVSESNNGIFNTGYSQENHQPQQQQSSNGNVNGNGNSNDSVVEFGTNPIALNGNDSNETSSGYGSWMGQSVHTSFHPKPSLYQTPIFGIE